MGHLQFHSSTTGNSGGSIEFTVQHSRRRLPATHLKIVAFKAEMVHNYAHILYIVHPARGIGMKL